MPRTRTQRPITYRDRQSRVWYVSEVARFKVVSPAIDGPNVALVIRFEREGEERFARWVGGDEWRQRAALHRLFAEAEPVGVEAPVTAQMAEAVEPPPVAPTPAPNDASARDDDGRTLARDYDPQQALLVAEPPTGDRWLHEIKLDGFRMGVLVAGHGKTRETRILSRKGTDYTTEFPEMVEAAMELPARAAILDGEASPSSRSISSPSQTGDRRTCGASASGRDELTCGARPVPHLALATPSARGLP